MGAGPELLSATEDGHLPSGVWSKAGWNAAAELLHLLDDVYVMAEREGVPSTVKVGGSMTKSFEEVYDLPWGS